MDTNRLEVKLTPKEIVEKQFTQVKKGYDTTEVDAYLDQVINDYEVFYQSVKQLEAQNKALKEQLANVQAVNRFAGVSTSETNIVPESDMASTNFEIIQRLSALESKVYNLEQLAKQKQ